MRIIAYRSESENGKVLLRESTGYKITSHSPAELFYFLIEQYDDKTTDPKHRVIRIAWELDRFVAPLLKLLGKAQCLKLHQTHKAHHAPFNIFYIPSKIFSLDLIPSPRSRANFYDLAQYYPELDEPEDLEEVQMLGEVLLKELKKMELEPTKLTSPVAIYEQCVMQDLDLPKLTDMPKEAAEFAYRCSGKLWIEAHQLGYWE